MRSRLLTAAMLAAMAATAVQAAPAKAPAARTAPAAVFGLPSASPESQGFSAERLKKLDATMHAYVDRGVVPGVATYVIRHGKLVHSDIYGKKDAASGAALSADTVYRMYSQTKPVTGAAMMILYEEGRWRLDDPVTKFLPELKDLAVFKGMGPDGKPITEPIKRPATMRELMSHTAGFAYGLVTDNPVDKAYRDSDLLRSPGLTAFTHNLVKLPLANQPGEHWKYSVAVDVQGAIIERLSGQSLPDFMASRIFRPLGMKDTGFYVPAEKASRLASLYAFNPDTHKTELADGFWVLDVSKPPALAMGGGGLVSTASDYARFTQMVLNGGVLDGVRILSPSTVELMRANHLSDAVLAQQPLGPGAGFGLDYMVLMDPAAAGSTAGKGTFSWGGAAGTWFWIDPANDVVVLGFIQVIGGGALRLDKLSEQLIYQALVEPDK